MTFWAILPVKPLRLGKSRLAGVLDEEERFRLNQDLLKNTLLVLKAVPEVERVLVISRDPQVLAMARDFKACTLQESGTRGLNTALNKATQMARSFAVQSVLAVPADLPLINVADIQELLALAEHPPVVVIAPTGTAAGRMHWLLTRSVRCAMLSGEILSKRTARKRCARRCAWR